MTTLNNPTAYPSLKQTWGLLGITLLAAIVLNVLLLLASVVITLLDSSETSQAFISDSLTFLLSYTLLFIVVIYVAVRKKKRHEGVFAPNFSLPSPLLLVAIIVATLGIYFLVDPLVDLIPMPDFVEQLFLQLLGDQDIWTVLAVVVAAPICEELLLRGVILDGLLKLYSPPKAIIWSALFFGILHANPWQFIGAVAIGLFMGWIYYRTRSLLATMIIHFVANGTGVLLGFLLLPDADRMVPTRTLFGNNTLYFSLLAVAAIIAAGLIFYLKKNLPAQSSKSEPAL